MPAPDHIIQSALLIGGTDGNPALVTIDASDAVGNPLVEMDDSLAGALASSGTGHGSILTDDAVSRSEPSGALSQSPATSSISATASATVPEPPAVWLPIIALICFAGRAAFRGSRVLSRAG
jgi:hypothetical protein